MSFLKLVTEHGLTLDQAKAEKRMELIADAEDRHPIPRSVEVRLGGGTPIVVSAVEGDVLPTLEVRFVGQAKVHSLYLAVSEVEALVGFLKQFADAKTGRLRAMEEWRAVCRQMDIEAANTNAAGDSKA